MNKSSVNKRGCSSGKNFQSPFLTTNLSHLKRKTKEGLEEVGIKGRSGVDKRELLK